MPSGDHFCSPQPIPPLETLGAKVTLTARVLYTVSKKWHVLGRPGCSSVGCYFTDCSLFKTQAPIHRVAQVLVGLGRLAPSQFITLSDLRNLLFRYHCLHDYLYQAVLAHVSTLPPKIWWRTEVAVRSYGPSIIWDFATSPSWRRAPEVRRGLDRTYAWSTLRLFQASSTSL